MAHTLHGKNIVGQELSAQGKKTFQAYDPAAGKKLDPLFYEGTTEEVDRSLKLAAQAFEVYRELEPAKRAAFLDRCADEIEALGDTLLDRASAETGLAKKRLENERGRTCYQLRTFAECVREGSWIEARIDRAIPDRLPVPKPDMRRMLIPLGPVVVFGASNFPLAYSIAGGDTASALAAGCPVITKAHPAHPGTSELVATALARAAKETGMPDGVFSMIHAKGFEIGMALVEHPLTCAVGFTGSLKGGRALFDAAARRPVPMPVYAEMGSVNPIFLLPGALQERGGVIAEGLHQSVTLGMGQFCTSPGLVFGGEGEALDKFLGDLAGRFSGTAPGTMLHPGIREAYQEGVERLRRTQGVQLVAESKATANEEKTEAGACVFATTGETFLKDESLSEEVFGPATIVVKTGSPQHLEQIARGLEGHLTASVHGTDEDLANYRSLIAILETKVGRLIFNGYPTGLEVCPSTQHGGPYPATTDSRTTSVGTAAITRFARPVCYQSFPQRALPAELQDENRRSLWRLVDNALTKESVG
jgi:NADP-dependent aldehyde dehydrogenase